MAYNLDRDAKVEIPPNDKRTFCNNITPIDLQTGIYQGFLNFENELHSGNIPVSFVIKQLVNKNNLHDSIGRKSFRDVIFGNGYSKVHLIWLIDTWQETGVNFILTSRTLNPINTAIRYCLGGQRIQIYLYL